MPFLPGYFEKDANENGWSQSQKITYISLEYLVASMYVALIVLNLRNVYAILIKQKEYKKLPIFAFYAFALIALTLRLSFIIGYWTGNPVFLNLDWVQ